MQLNIQLSAHFDHIDLALNYQGTLQGIVGIFGHSGSGKSTLLRAIAGLSNNVSGSIYYKQQCLFNSKENIFVKAEQRNIALVFQDSRLFPHLSVLQNLQFSRQRSRTKQLNVDEIIALTQLTPLLDKKPAQLSGGEQQRVALARAILAEPQLLLLDEPLSALDQQNKVALLLLLTKVQKYLKIPMLYVSHSLAELQQVADNLLVLAQGKIIDHGNIHQVIHRLNQQQHSPIHQQTSLSLVISKHDKDHGLTALTLSEKHTLYLPLLSAENYPVGSTLRCFIFADDISITIEAPHQSSIVNHLSGRVSAIQPLNQHSMLVTIVCNEQEFFSQISVWSYKKLNLAEKKQVFIQFKASAIRAFANPNNFIEE